MESLSALVRNHRKLAVGVVFLIIAAGVLFYNAPWQEGEAEELPLPGYTLEDTSESAVTSANASTLESVVTSEGEVSDSHTEKDAQIIVVDVKGAVRHPGIYTLPEGSRVFQAVEAAGSFLENADNRLLNMAVKLVDGAVVYVPEKLAGVKNPSVENNTSENNASRSDSGEATLPLTVGLMPNSLQPGVNPPVDENSSSGSATGKININTASAEELQQLKGIGPTKAQEIIRYRETNGPFRSIEELAEIKGIGTKTIEKLGNDITVK